MMLPQPIFLNKLIQFLSSENLNLNNFKKDIENIISKKDLQFLLDLNTKIMGIAKIIIQDKKEVDILLPQHKLQYIPTKLEAKKDFEIELDILENCSNEQLLDIIKQEYPNNIVKELTINLSKEKIKILFIVNEIPKFLKSIYKECDFKDYGLMSYIEFDKIFNLKIDDFRYFTLITPFGAKKIQLYWINEHENFQETLNCISIPIPHQ
ncbi:hypothetical protein [Campylobacter lari]|uniref:Uncharacterized protein n=1 Tax=Campylobacter lari NCTC 11845 TaxID=1388749 RepID=A0A0A8HVN6_CAMLA|nr:hypothetical protein [Campylobacter lari]AJD01870.1 hypothetical protein UPTC3659_1029 [Campylobacter lari NCTC 11845]AJD01882.1 hypothetical protein UPTC3659_1041 [Campylobacter lari NCTC 11845]AJD01894.1 hypothetical protein UPTC3659_1053 [Campylobacter lari NCTC 11845]AJD01904.1 hypothetical protein UPTC3659_1065 [Campylobacter lari NCTC 11845]